MPEVSVIFPVYNTSQYLPELFDEMLSQTFSDCEFIFVDDGSTDNSAEIIKEFQKKDSRISYYYQENSGGGAARNFGISKAKGKYVICLDSDDKYEKNLIEEMYNQAVKTDADITISKFSWLYTETGGIVKGKGIDEKDLPSKEVFSSKDVDDILQLTVPSPWNKFYKLSFIKDNNLQYSTTRIINDLKFGMLALILAKKITVVNKDLLTYRYKTAGSGSNSREKYINNSITVFSEIYREFVERDLFEEYKSHYFSKIFDTINYEMSFPVSDEVIGKIKELLNNSPFNTMDKSEFVRYLNIDRMKKHVFEYFWLNFLTFGKNNSIKEKYKSSKLRTENLKKLGFIEK